MPHSIPQTATSPTFISQWLSVEGKKESNGKSRACVLQRHGRALAKKCDISCWQMTWHKKKNVGFRRLDITLDWFIVSSSACFIRLHTIDICYCLFTSCAGSFYHNGTPLQIAHLIYEQRYEFT